MSNGEEGPRRGAPWRRGRTISQRPSRQARSASRTPPTIVRCRLRGKTNVYFDVQALRVLEDLLEGLPVELGPDSHERHERRWNRGRRTRWLRSSGSANYDFSNREPGLIRSRQRLHELSVTLSEGFGRGAVDPYLGTRASGQRCSEKHGDAQQVALHFGGRHLTVKLRGRTQEPARRRGRTLSAGARSANQEAPHGPLQRLLDGMALVLNGARFPLPG